MDARRYLLALAALFTLGNALSVTCLAGSNSGPGGNYGGLLQVPDADQLSGPITNGHLPNETPLNSGTVTVQLNDSGHFTAVLNWQGYRYQFKGNINLDTNNFTRDFDDRGFPGQTLTLNLLLHADTHIIDCSLTS